MLVAEKRGVPFLERMVERNATFDVLGIPVSVLTLDTASERIHMWARDRIGRMVIIRDVNGVMEAQKNSQLMRIHKEADMVTPDGMPLVWLGKMSKLPVKRTCGPDLMARLISDSERSGLKHYFYGGKPGVAERLRSIFLKTHPHACIVGCGMPPFRPLTDDELIAAAASFNAAEADVVWIGISTPKQEYLMKALRPLVQSTLIGVGAAFDFHIGAVTRAPRWMQSTGLEWLWRLASEPRRLWRRYLVSAPQFVLRAIVQNFSRREPL